MRILQVSDFFPPVMGGLENHVADLSAALARRGHDVHVATLTSEPVGRDGVTCHVVGSLASTALRYQDPTRRFHPPLPDPRARSDLRALVDRLAPDVIHGHSWLAVSLPGPAMQRLVFTLHDYSLACQLRTLLTADGAICSGPGPVKCVRCASGMPGTARHPIMMAGTRVGRRILRPRRFLAVSERVRDRLEPFLRQECRVIPNFVDSDISKGDYGVPSRDFALFAGDPGLHKGVDVLARAWSGPQRPEVPLLMATTRPAQLALPEGVISIQASRAAVLEAIHDAMCVVVPSNWDDPFPTVALEALVLGTPIIATAVGGLPEIVRPGINGYLIPRGSDRELVTRVNELAHSPETVERLSRGAFEGAASFTSDTVVPAILAVYEEVVSEVR